MYMIHYTTKHDNKQKKHGTSYSLDGIMEIILKIQNKDQHKHGEKERKSKSRALKKQGQNTMNDFGFTDGEIENIFDLIEEEYPDL